MVELDLCHTSAIGEVIYMIINASLRALICYDLTGQGGGLWLFKNRKVKRGIISRNNVFFSFLSLFLFRFFSFLLPTDSWIGCFVF